MRVVVSSFPPDLQQTRECNENQILRDHHLQVQDPNVFLSEPVSKFCNHLTAKYSLRILTMAVLMMNNILMENVKLVPRVFLHQIYPCKFNNTRATIFSPIRTSTSMPSQPLHSAGVLQTLFILY